MSNVVKPYKESDKSKKEQVIDMFNNISGNYDFLNHFLSLGIDKLWRKKAIRLLKESKPDTILDIATGTGDFALEALKLAPSKITGMDISIGMLDKGREKIQKKGLSNLIDMQLGDSENIPLETESYDAITVGFGVRNFQNLELGLSEMHRVLKQDGIAAILEFSKPAKFPIKQIFHIYSHYILPFIGRIVSKDSRAYTYLPESVAAFPEGQTFVNILTSVGYSDVKRYPLSGGIATIYLAKK